MNTLVIGDLHSPFIKKGYLKHCKNISKQFNCKRIHCTGDILDNHFSSFHATDPDGHGALEEFERAVKELKPWYRAFPEMTISLGNHDKIPKRKALENGISMVWIQTVADVMHNNGFTGWDFAPSFKFGGVKYIHGKGLARTRMTNEGVSIVQGHKHSFSSIDFHVTERDIFFALQVGCGIDTKSYAMVYADEDKKQIISCGVVIDDKVPIILPMKMG